MIKWRSIIFCSLLSMLLPYSSFARSEEKTGSVEELIEIGSNDVVCYEEASYFIRQSPVISLEGYGDLFPYSFPFFPASTRWDATYPINSLHYEKDHKSYSCKWAVCDDKLLLLFIDVYDKELEVYRKNSLAEGEEFARFVKGTWSHEWDEYRSVVTYRYMSRDRIVKKLFTPSEGGAMWADWFSGTLDMVAFFQYEEIYPIRDFDQWSLRRKYLPYRRLHFEKGVVVKEETIKPTQPKR